jgi:hypothetical protein
VNVGVTICLCRLRIRHARCFENSVAKLWSWSTSFPFRTVLLADIAIFWTQQAVRGGRLWGKFVFEERIRTLACTTSGSKRLLRLTLYPIFQITGEWQYNDKLLE